MMYRLRWEDSATNELTELWLAAEPALRAEITRATASVDHRLLTDPLGQSESREAEMRVLIDSPLTVTFRLETDRQTVSVLRVWMRPSQPS